MGFFDLKATCGVCNKEVGLNRYKIKKSDSWVCPECFKKAGGSSVVNVGRVTIEEIKEIINDKNDRLVNSPLSTAEGMYKYSKDNGFGSGSSDKWSLKHFSILEKNLMPGEEIKMVFIGLHNYVSATKHDENFAYAITNKRIIMGQQKAIGESFQSIQLRNINDITFKAGLIVGIITIDSVKEVFNVALDKSSAKEINAKIHEVLEEVMNPGNTTNRSTNSAPQVPASAADEIKKFKELLDMGAITEEEFDSKKKQLLGM